MIVSSVSFDGPHGARSWGVNRDARDGAVGREADGRTIACRRGTTRPLPSMFSKSAANGQRTFRLEFRFRPNAVSEATEFGAQEPMVELS